MNFADQILIILFISTSTFVQLDFCPTSTPKVPNMAFFEGKLQQLVLTSLLAAAFFHRTTKAGCKYYDTSHMGVISSKVPTNVCTESTTRGSAKYACKSDGLYSSNPPPLSPSLPPTQTKKKKKKNKTKLVIPQNPLRKTLYRHTMDHKQEILFLFR